MKIVSGSLLTVTEALLAELRAGRAFAGTRQQAGVAATLSQTQLFNPAGSGRTVLCVSLRSFVTTAQQISVRQHNTALTTLGSPGINLLSGGTAPAAEIRGDNPTGVAGAAFAQDALLANESEELFPFAWIMELGQGEGVHVATTVLNTTLQTNFRWVEM